MVQILIVSIYVHCFDTSNRELSLPPFKPPHWSSSCSKHHSKQPLNARIIHITHQGNVLELQASMMQKWVIPLFFWDTKSFCKKPLKHQITIRIITVLTSQWLFSCLILYSILTQQSFYLTALTLIVTFPLVTFLMLKPTVGIMSSLNCPLCRYRSYRKSVYRRPSHPYGGH